MEEIRDCLERVTNELFGVEEVPVEMAAVPEGQEGDYASNVAMRLAGILKGKLEEGLPKNPREIAEKIAAEMAEKGFEVKVAGPGFLNFILSDEYFERKVAEMAADFEKNISQNEYFGKKVVCEFSDPNPFKVLHVGHLYTSMVGDSIARLVECAGGEVVRANFGGDVGLHVAKTIYALMKSHEKADDIEKIAKCYVEGTRAYEDDEGARAEITRLNSEIYEIAEKGPEFVWEPECLGDEFDRKFPAAEVAEVYWQGREVSYKYFEDFYARIGVKFDKYYPESMVTKRGLTEVRKGLSEGVYEESDGAVIFPGEKYGLHTRVFINQAGLPTYEAKDVGLLFTKWDDYHFDESIVITGNDIIEYMKVVLKSVALMRPELAERTMHITHGNVRLPGNEKMSSRKGNFIKAVDVLESVKKLVPEEKIALGAIRYAFLKYRIGGNIEFDAKESVSTTGNSGVYLQYAAVRARKVLSRCGARELAGSEKAAGRETGDGFGEPEERELARKVCEYREVLAGAIHELAPHKIAGYLYEAAQVFSRFYEKVKVAGSEREAERAELVSAYLKVMEHGLNLLGIEIPDEM